MLGIITDRRLALNHMKFTLKYIIMCDIGAKTVPVAMAAAAAAQTVTTKVKKNKKPIAHVFTRLTRLCTRAFAFSFWFFPLKNMTLIKLFFTND